MRALLAAALLGLFPAAALGASYWGFGVPGQSSATITWQPDNGQKVNAVLFSLPVKAKSAKTRLGTRCTIPRGHPKQVRCAISPAAVTGIVDVRTKAHMPCKATVGFRVRPAGQKQFVRQQAIPSANGCG